MSILDDRTHLATLDKAQVLSSIDQLPAQIDEAWQASSTLSFTFDPTTIQHVVVAGMGGSALGARVIKSLYQNQVPYSFEFITDYTLPGYLNEHTFVILSSYSGTTEETLAAAQQALQKNAPLAAISSGQDLVKLAQTHHFPFYQIVPNHNPSNQPRMAIGYSITGIIGLLQAAGLLHLNDTEIPDTIAFLTARAPTLAPEAKDSPIKHLATDIQNDFLVLISAEHAIGATHVINNQINENAKHLTTDLVLPEMNHHYLEALSFPDHAKFDHYFLLIDSSLYSDPLRLRLKITHRLISEKGYPTHVLTLTGKTPFIQTFELIQTGAYLAFYLAMLHGIDPAPIPTVDYFKAAMKEAKR